MLSPLKSTFPTRSVVSTLELQNSQLSMYRNGEHIAQEEGEDERCLSVSVISLRDY